MPWADSGHSRDALRVSVGRATAGILRDSLQDSPEVGTGRQAR